MEEVKTFCDQRSELFLSQVMQHSCLPIVRINRQLLPYYNTLYFWLEHTNEIWPHILACRPMYVATLKVIELYFIF